MLHAEGYFLCFSIINTGGRGFSSGWITASRLSDVGCASAKCNELMIVVELTLSSSNSVIHIHWCMYVTLFAFFLFFPFRWELTTFPKLSS